MSHLHELPDELENSSFRSKQYSGGVHLPQVIPAVPLLVGEVSEHGLDLFSQAEVWAEQGQKGEEHLIHQGEGHEVQGWVWWHNTAI